jgi:drug/metabolite transporter (DMT)-like permease
MSWLWLSLLCAFSLASMDAATKWFFAGQAPAAIALVRFAGVAIFVLPFLLIETWPTLPWQFWAWLAVLVPIEILSMLMYMRAISTSPLSRTLPYLAFTPVCATLTGLVFLGERISTMGLVGILLVAFGAYLLNIDQLRQSGRLRIMAPLQWAVTDKGARLMLGTAALYSITSVMGKHLLSYASPWFFGPFYSIVLSLAVLPLTYQRAPDCLSMFRNRTGGVAIVAALAALEAVTHYLAIQQANVAYMLAAKRTSLVFGILYGALLFKEEGLKQHLLAGTFMLLGVAIIAQGA